MPKHSLLNNIFPNVETSENASLHFKKITDEHPYFGLAHFYNLKYLGTEDINDGKAASKSSLFFTSNFYIHAQLNAPAFPITADVDDKNIETNNSIASEQKSEGITEEKEELLFEPLHASDYFASQGIKLSDDALGADKLGKQLKSFTAWLKTMKKVHPDKLPLVNKITETAVQTQAEQSNIEEEIVTEPMAEAYVLQNKQAKAIEIYNKLSLINPAKSAYFAAKIDSLKK